MLGLCSCYLFVELLCLVAGQSKPSRITEHPVDTVVPRNEPATLQCKADGYPSPVITWFKDGEPIHSSSGDSRSHRIVLPGGPLFFLHVTHSRRESDSGIYWCLARNSLGVVRSKNATLTVAYLQSEFKDVPLGTRSVQGETVTLHCDPPKGQPDPQVKWKKNGQLINFDNFPARYRIEPTGLIIENVEPGDSGRYQCVAFNVAGSRESPHASLTVHVKPEIIRSPQNVQIIAGEDAYFECFATGDPPPIVSWRKEKKNVAEGKSLRIEDVKEKDEGVYVCVVENAVGMVMVNASLTVFVPPAISSVEPFVRVELGDTTTLPCFSEGLPTPYVQWTREGYNEWGLMQPDSGREGERLKVTIDGTLVIRQITPEDAGTYICLAVNFGGGEISRTRVLMISKKPTHIPPIISRGPSNQTLPSKSNCVMFCDVDGANVIWHKDGNGVLSDGEKILIGNNGTLQIKDLDLSDAGNYTCVAKSIGGATAWSAQLHVSSPDNAVAKFERAPSDPLVLPGSPSKPHLISRGPGSATVTWKSGIRMGASPLIGYQVEVFSADTRNATEKGHWRTVAQRLSDDTFTLAVLQPGSSHLVLIRAENSHGLSLPSPVSDWIEITETFASEADEGEVEQTREALSGHVLRLDKIVPVNSTSARVIWEVLDGQSYMESVDIVYRLVRHLSDHSFRSLDETDFGITSFGDPGALSVLVGNLRPNSVYMFYVLPKGKGTAGRPSNSKEVATLQDAPSEPPTDIRVRQLNSTCIFIEWAPPPRRALNGDILGYHIFVSRDQTTKFTRNLTIGAHSNSALVPNLIPGYTYVVRSSATTIAGEGPVSEPVTFPLKAESYGLEPGEAPYPADSSMDISEVIQKAWFVLVIGGLLVAALIVLAGALIAHRTVTKKKNLSSFSATLSKSGEIIHASYDPSDLLCSRGWSTSEYCKGAFSTKQLVATDSSNSDYAELEHNKRCLYDSTAPSAYATTTIVTSSYKTNSVFQQQDSFAPDLIRPVIPHSYPMRETDIISPESDTSSYLTDDSNCSRRARHRLDSNTPKWSEFLPPPPSYPPPENSFSTFTSQKKGYLRGNVATRSLQNTPAFIKRNNSDKSFDYPDQNTEGAAYQVTPIARCGSRSSHSSFGVSHRKPYYSPEDTMQSIVGIVPRKPALPKRNSENTGTQGSRQSDAGETHSASSMDRSTNNDGDSPLYAEANLLDRKWRSCSSSTTSSYR